MTYKFFAKTKILFEILAVTVNVYQIVSEQIIFAIPVLSSV